MSAMLEVPVERSCRAAQLAHITPADIQRSEINAVIRDAQSEPQAAFLFPWGVRGMPMRSSPVCAAVLIRHAPNRFLGVFGPGSRAAELRAAVNGWRP